MWKNWCQQCKHFGVTKISPNLSPSKQRRHSNGTCYLRDAINAIDYGEIGYYSGILCNSIPDMYPDLPPDGFYKDGKIYPNGKIWIF